MIPHLTAPELAQRLAAGEALQLLDVREPEEWAIAHLPGARLVPLATLPEALPALDSQADWVVYCHHGVRSLHAAGYMQAQGFGRVSNLLGGIDAYSAQVDPALPRY
ncbi:MAG: rhodanese-like domain-containing protein [Candidatus Sericytochromatia bacterium]|nr:rhodanese-like domain-containing protein [Candidatus Sericytochromatia bacterium]